ncbi:hypothetical protein [uncultured Rubinisphaera sp.]|uniref:hypothetical protein n=2 Tax=Rubinisphaera TaxID=1649490 RepID=UPI0030D6EE1D
MVSLQLGNGMCVCDLIKKQVLEGHKDAVMLSSLWYSICFYANFYYTFVLRWWSNITPAEYGVVLIGVGVFGWILLKSASRK